jgi:hypothetical protein
MAQGVSPEFKHRYSKKKGGGPECWGAAASLHTQVPLRVEGNTQETRGFRKEDPRFWLPSRRASSLKAHSWVSHHFGRPEVRDQDLIHPIWSHIQGSEPRAALTSQVTVSSGISCLHRDPATSPMGH